MLNFGESGATL